MAEKSDQKLVNEEKNSSGVGIESPHSAQPQGLLPCPFCGASGVGSYLNCPRKASGHTARKSLSELVAQTASVSSIRSVTTSQANIRHKPRGIHAAR